MSDVRGHVITPEQLMCIKDIFYKIGHVTWRVNHIDANISSMSISCSGVRADCYTSPLDKRKSGITSFIHKIPITPF